MNVVEQPEPPATKPLWLRLGSTWFFAAALAGPLGIVLHEIVHFLTAVAFGFEGAALHFASAGYADHDAFWRAYLDESSEAAGHVLPVWQVGAVAAAGVVFTWALAVSSALLAPGRGLRTFGGALLGAFALLAPARGYTGLSYILTVRPHYPNAFPNFDEFRAAAALGVPVDVPVAVGVVVVLFCWAYLVPKVRRDLIVVVPALLLGTAAGILAWLVVGPLVLP
jgi:hypothetical protein